ncbi:MAG: RNA pyrophosphohydrolase [SAR116 cluster bacterium]|nr:RNA pyrophosphohydrolase [SAR116 cluster bacterium]RPH08722.1 MAG: RNA pyrophosphohydrolase [Alphaproteobacteria bacterium TMED54]|tara:strand:+ start:1037 stop:1531 length:495 start_codon:yes stop_codon:yes gene_type:complete
MNDLKPLSERPYRPCVGIMVFNNEGLVFSGKRIDNPNNAWQLPQGGIDNNETPIEAGFRELIEETSINSVEYIAEYPDWINYDVPHNLANKLWNGQFRGQTQKWVLFNFTGDDNEININTEYPEFNEWQWTSPLDLTNKAIYFKKDVYEKINLIFLPIIKDFIN